MEQTRDQKELKAFAERLIRSEFKNETQVKKEMEALGLVYTTDEIKRMNQVLLALHSIKEEASPKEDSTKKSHKEASY